MYFRPTYKEFEKLADSALGFDPSRDDENASKAVKAQEKGYWAAAVDKTKRVSNLRHGAALVATVLAGAAAEVANHVAAKHGVDDFTQKTLSILGEVVAPLIAIPVVSWCLLRTEIEMAETHANFPHRGVFGRAIKLLDADVSPGA